MFGVYIHFPYCRKRCLYCDFAVHARPRIPHEAYAEKVEAELAERAALFAGRRPVSIYFGGGTPGLWRADCVAQVIRAISAHFEPATALEVTLEANPDDLSLAHLEALHAAGVNRLSLGVQSLAPRALERLGRLHGPAEAERAVLDARRAGFANLSLDLMFGLPEQSLTELEADLAGLLALAPEHLSVYGLTVEPRTAFGALLRGGLLPLPEPAVQAEMYERVQGRLAAAGFEQYEISSFCRPGQRSRHNSLYWTGGEYLGLGVSAHSFRRLDGGGGERFSTVRSVDAWLIAPAIAETETLDATTLEREAIWLGLRLLDGVDREAHRRLYGVDPVTAHHEAVDRLATEGLLEVSERRLRLTRRGILFADEVGSRFV